MSKIEIRSARAEDLAAIKGIFESYRSDHDWAYAERYFKQYFAFPELNAGRRVLVGVDEGRVLGVIGYLPDEYETDDVYWLGWFYVHREAKGRRHGKRLLDRVVRELRKKGARKLYTDTSSWGFYDRARHRYKEYGFKREARLKDYYEKGEDQVIYGMDLK